MKKIMIIIMMFITVSSFSSCIVTISYDHSFPCPYGKWENETIGLTLDIKPGGNGFFGTYDNHGKNIDIIILFPIGINEFYICEIGDYNEYGSYGSQLFSGEFQAKDDKLYYTLEPDWQKVYGIKDTIVFEQVEEYEVPVVSAIYESPQENSQMWRY